jgi:hypothetical protein
MKINKNKIKTLELNSFSFSPLDDASGASFDLLELLVDGQEEDYRKACYSTQGEGGGTVYFYDGPLIIQSSAIKDEGKGARLVYIPAAEMCAHAFLFFRVRNFKRNPVVFLFSVPFCT